MKNTHYAFRFLAFWFLLTPLLAQASGEAARIETVIQTAKSYLGTPHRMGGMDHRGIDCSGLMVVSFRAAGKALPRRSQDQARMGQRVNRRNLQAGDLVFFKPDGKLSHVGLVVATDGRGDAEFIHTSSSRGVMLSRLSEGYWDRSYVKSRRIWEGIYRQPGPHTASRELVAAPGRFPEASFEKLKKRDLKRLSPAQRSLIADEILARRGYLFEDLATRRYFEGQHWYQELPYKTDSWRKMKKRLSKIERKNLKRIEKLQE
jgi:probable lipoprotein NlpC